MTSELLGQALIEEATKKSGLVWVQGPDGPARALWHVWHEGAACLIGDGPGEQPLPGLADGAEARVTVRSKDKGGGWSPGRLGSPSSRRAQRRGTRRSPSSRANG